MIESKTKKIMYGGMLKFAKEKDVSVEDVQINISFQENSNILVYSMCYKWQPEKEVGFKYILNKKLDLLGLEQMSVPVLRHSLLFYVEKYNLNRNNASVFLFNKNETIGLSVFNGAEPIFNVSLKNHLTLIGY